MKKIKCYSSYEDAEKDDIEYYSNLDPNMKIVELEKIRESYFNLIGLSDEDRKIKKILQIDDMKLNQKIMNVETIKTGKCPVCGSLFVIPA